MEIYNTFKVIAAVLRQWLKLYILSVAFWTSANSVSVSFSVFPSSAVGATIIKIKSAATRHSYGLVFATCIDLEIPTFYSVKSKIPLSLLPFPALLIRYLRLSIWVCILCVSAA